MSDLFLEAVVRAAVSAVNGALADVGINDDFMKKLCFRRMVGRTASWGQPPPPWQPSYCHKGQNRPWKRQRRYTVQHPTSRSQGPPAQEC
ncbi:hypothetical protein EYB58_14265 [Desulfobacter hydrogenophilus]|nr:hypothetical protein EYB58_14265 [Desulfobacter hydrogenophilus]